MDFDLHRKEIAEKLPQAIENHNIMPFYQPKVHIKRKELFGCEALARWKFGGSIISPTDFIPDAEKNGIIASLDLYMLRSVCRDIREWLDSGIEPVPVSVNYSQQNFIRPTLITETLDIINEFDIDGKYIEFEITETSYIENFEVLEEFVNEMHRHGIRVSLDDFGVGYSSFKMFSTLDIDTIKLDKSLFEGDNAYAKKNHAILKNITSMINDIDALTVAEGIESSKQLDLVREIGGNIVQGYIFDKPLEKAEFTKRLISKKYEIV